MSDPRRPGLPVRAAVPLLLGGVAALALGSLLLGRYPIPPAQVVGILASRILPWTRDWPDTMATVLLQVRLPRIAAALLVGGALASSGAALQGLFKNPLVSPSILGVSAGAGFGAALGLLLSLPMPMIQAAAFLCGLLAVLATLAIGRGFGTGSLTILVLAGIVVSALFSALIALAKVVADPVDKLPAITFWLLGSLAKASGRDVLLVCAPVALSYLLLHGLRWQLNVMALGEEEAMTLGVDGRRVMAGVILATTLMTAAAVGISGMVGWVGLLIPHLARMLVGPAFPDVLPVSFLMGGGYLLLVDGLARGSGHGEIPLGVLTAIIGAPFFIFLLARMKRGGA
ncbi:MAG: iron ABC transporter permease [Holophaga sp.]|nr:iron ABC transporter permease [Holophaga sp.]